jgi:hypothetical protein
MMPWIIILLEWKTMLLGACLFAGAIIVFGKIADAIDPWDANSLPPMEEDGP